MSNIPDAQLVEQCLEGNNQEFEELVNRYQKPLFNAALKIVDDRDTAKDVTQIAFIKAYENLDKYNPKFKFFSWIYRMVVNEAINVLRQQKSNVVLDECEIQSEDNPESNLNTLRIEEKIETAVAKLPLDYR